MGGKRGVHLSRDEIEICPLVGWGYLIAFLLFDKLYCNMVIKQYIEISNIISILHF